MKKYIVPLVIGIIGVLVCAGLLIYQNTILQKENEDLVNGIKPEESQDPEKVPENAQPDKGNEQTV